MNKILIIDEDRKINALANVLRLIHEIPCDVENDPVAAINRLKNPNLSYEVVLLDIMMPWKEAYSKFEQIDLNLSGNKGLYTGIHLLKYIRTEPEIKSKRLKIIIHSAMVKDNLKAYVKTYSSDMSWAADGLFQKAIVSTEELAKKIKEYCDNEGL